MVHTEDRVDPVADLDIIHHELRLKVITPTTQPASHPPTSATARRFAHLLKLWPEPHVAKPLLHYQFASSIAMGCTDQLLRPGGGSNLTL